jgi:hypothetical protein
MYGFFPLVDPDPKQTFDKKNKFSNCFGAMSPASEMKDVLDRKTMCCIECVCMNTQKKYRYYTV